MGSADESRGICRMGAVSGEHDLSWTSPDLSSCSTNDSDWPLSNNHYSSRSGTESVSEPLSLEQPDSVAYSDDCKNLSRTCGNGFRNYCHHRRNSDRATDDVPLDGDNRCAIEVTLPPLQAINLGHHLPPHMRTDFTKRFLHMAKSSDFSQVLGLAHRSPFPLTGYTRPTESRLHQIPPP